MRMSYFLQIVFIIAFLQIGIGLILAYCEYIVDCDKRRRREKEE